MNEKVAGTIIVLKETVQVSEKFSKREFVVQTEDEKYPQMIPIQFTQDKCEMLDGFSVGDVVEVSVNMNGRLWTSPQGEDKYFLSLSAWRIDHLENKLQEDMQEQDIKELEDEGLPF
tara:strand:- start:694 stop:1044 length:351 start_codon:yes stop_codon:yes gene_type:complete